MWKLKLILTCEKVMIYLQRGNTSHHWPLVQEIPMDSQHKGSVMERFDSFFDVNLVELQNKHLSGWWNKIPCDITLMRVVVPKWYSKLSPKYVNGNVKWQNLWLKHVTFEILRSCHYNALNERWVIFQNSSKTLLIIIIWLIIEV